MPIPPNRSEPKEPTSATAVGLSESVDRHPPAAVSRFHERKLFLLGSCLGQKVPQWPGWMSASSAQAGVFFVRSRADRARSGMSVRRRTSVRM